MKLIGCKYICNYLVSQIYLELFFADVLTLLILLGKGNKKADYPKIIRFVPRKGIEPPRPKSLDFESSASTNWFKHLIKILKV